MSYKRRIPSALVKSLQDQGSKYLIGSYTDGLQHYTFTHNDHSYTVVTDISNQKTFNKAWKDKGWGGGSIRCHELVAYAWRYGCTVTEYHSVYENSIREAIALNHVETVTSFARCTTAATRVQLIKWMGTYNYNEMLSLIR